MRFSPMAVSVNLKRFNVSEHDFGPKCVQNLKKPNWLKGTRKYCTNSAVTFNGFPFLANISQSMLSYNSKFNPIAVNVPLKSFNGLDHENGAQGFPKWPPFILEVFVSISISKTNQRSRFGSIDLMTLLKKMGGSDYDFGDHKIVKIQKKQSP